MRLVVFLMSRFTFYHIVGWNKEKDHFDVMETSEYACHFQRGDEGVSRYDQGG